MSLWDEVMIPFRGIGEVGQRITAGSVVLLHQGRGLAKKGLKRVPRPDKSASLGDKVELLFVVAFGVVGAVVLLAAVGGLLLHLLAPYAILVAIATLAAWSIAAMVIAPPQVARKPTPARTPEGARPSTPPPSGDALGRLIRVVASKRDQRGVHLDELLPHLHGVDRAALVAALRAAGIPIREQLKLRLPNGRQSNRQGVHVEDLPALSPLAEKVGSEHPGSVVTGGVSRSLSEGHPAGD